ncbi:MAG: heat-inducible transcription repressor HrcA [Spirochaetes bacterium]|nr:heat-inducible transcription repressor HrcA [Spirochaetota bacterium]
MKKDNNTQNKHLSERESSVLKALVYEYIVSGKPIGSRSFVIKYSFSISPATMRNIMFDLEKMGYLTQPHTSAGRLPTDKGYRFYVESLLDSYEFTIDNNSNLNEETLRRELQIDQMFNSLTKMLSTVSNYAGVVLTPIPDYSIVKHIELVPLSENTVLFILVTRMGTVVNQKISISSSFSHDDLHAYSKYLTSELCGYSLFDIKKEVFDSLRQDKMMNSRDEIALDIAELALSKNENSQLYIDGIENLLHIPDMIEKDRMETLLHLLKKKETLKMIMEKNIDTDGVHTFIGEGIDGEDIYGCSIVSSSYKIGSVNVGSLGVLGPTRMDYEKIVPLVDYTGRMISNLLTRMVN